MCAEKVTINSLKPVPDPSIYLRGDLTVPDPDNLWHADHDQLIGKIPTILKERINEMNEWMALKNLSNKKQFNYDALVSSRCTLTSL